MKTGALTIIAAFLVISQFASNAKAQSGQINPPTCSQDLNSQQCIVDHNYHLDEHCRLFPNSTYSSNDSTALYTCLNKAESKQCGETYGKFKSSENSLISRCRSVSALENEKPDIDGDYYNKCLESLDKKLKKQDALNELSQTKKDAKSEADSLRTDLQTAENELQEAKTNYPGQEAKWAQETQEAQDEVQKIDDALNKDIEALEKQGNADAAALKDQLLSLGSKYQEATLTYATIPKNRELIMQAFEKACMVEKAAASKGRQTSLTKLLSSKNCSETRAKFEQQLLAITSQETSLANQITAANQQMLDLKSQLDKLNASNEAKKQKLQITSAMNKMKAIEAASRKINEVAQNRQMTLQGIALKEKRVRELQARYQAALTEQQGADSQLKVAKFRGLSASEKAGERMHTEIDDLRKEFSDYSANTSGWNQMKDIDACKDFKAPDGNNTRSGAKGGH